LKVLLLAAFMTTSSLAAGAELRYLALGDSYSIGEGVAAEGRWPVQLAAKLRGQGVALADPDILATTGWTTDELSAAMDRHTFQPPYDLVSLLIGVNNQYRGRDLDNFRDEFRALLARAIVLAGQRPRRLVVVSIPDWGVTAFAAGSGRDVEAIARDIDAFNAVKREEAAALGVAFVDITGISRVAGAGASMLAEDGLHPSAEQYARWTAAIAPVVARMLE
jgi:lysophospholipase L1-like esterase